MDNSIQTLSEKVSLIASNKTWIDGLAIDQLLTTANLPNILHVAGMPDLHPGQGYPIGAAYLSSEMIYPALIGSDIGCGMGFWQTDISLNKLSIDKLERHIGNIDKPLDQGKYKLGTIGGGNHFAELQKISKIYDERAVAQYQLNPNRLFLLIHSGSRGLGHAILQHYLTKTGEKGLNVTSEAAQNYLQKHDNALDFARLNRQTVAERLLGHLHSNGRSILDVHHNFVEPIDWQGKTAWLHRKGASPSTQGLVIVPGSRGDYSYLVKPISSCHSLFSLAHGAGRKWRRADCKAKLNNRYSADELMRTKLGSRVICGDRDLIYEEAPQAYKSIDSVIESMQQAHLINVIAQLAPVVTYKTQGDD